MLGPSESAMWKRHRQFVGIALLLLLVVGSPALAQGTETHWKLLRGKDISLARSGVPQLALKGQALSGSTGCNAFTATLTEQSDGKVSIDRPALTRKFCGGKQQAIENAFVDALGQTAFVQRSAEQLTFLSEARETLLVWQALPAAAAPRALARMAGKLPSTAARARAASAHKQVQKASPKRTANRGCGALFWAAWR
jgi:heat shock protein HslJ